MIFISRLRTQFDEAVAKIQKLEEDVSDVRKKTFQRFENIQTSAIKNVGEPPKSFENFPPSHSSMGKKPIEFAASTIAKPKPVHLPEQFDLVKVDKGLLQKNWDKIGGSNLNFHPIYFI